MQGKQKTTNLFLFLSVHLLITYPLPYVPKVNWSKSRSLPESEKLLSRPIRHAKVVQRFRWAFREGLQQRRRLVVGSQLLFQQTNLHKEKIQIYSQFKNTILHIMLTLDMRKQELIPKEYKLFTNKDEES